MFGEGIVIGLILGKASRGRFRNLEEISIRAWPLILIAFVLQVYPIFLGKVAFFQRFQIYAYAMSYILLIVCVALNLNHKEMWFIFIGILMNCTAVFLNGFQMPISFQGLKMIGLHEMAENILQGHIQRYIPLEDISNWTKILGKYIVIPKPYPFAKILSIGDLFMTLGIILWVRGRMIRSIFSRKTEMLRFKYK